MPALNPFIWDQAIEDGVPRDPFTEEIALLLKSGTHIALFGPRGTGKTSFTLELGRELALEHGDDAPPWESIRIDLRRAISIPAFVGAVSTAVAEHPNKAVRRRIQDAFKALEVEMGVNLGVFKAGVRSRAERHPDSQGEVLFEQLRALRSLDDHLVVIFDEFQRLNNCPGEPLSLIRSALMEPGGGGRVSLLLTGSMRERLELMLHNSKEPIWDQTHDAEIPRIRGENFTDYLEFRFEASGKPIGEEAVEELIRMTRSHPKRTQHLAWMTWQEAPAGAMIGVDGVRAAFETLIEKVSPGVDFPAMFDALLAGDDSDVNCARALLLLAAGHSPGSGIMARRYGLTHPNTTRRGLERMRERGVVQGSGSDWTIVDPLYAEWLRRQDP